MDLRYINWYISTKRFKYFLYIYICDQSADACTLTLCQLSALTDRKADNPSCNVYLYSYTFYDMDRECSMNEVDRNTYIVFYAKHKVVKRLRDPRRRWKDNILTYRPIARQRLSKHIPAGANTRKNRTSIARQGSVNTPKQCGIIEDGVFRGVRPEAI
jgi:hypothetical protein